MNIDMIKLKELALVLGLEQWHTELTGTIYIDDDDTTTVAEVYLRLDNKDEARQSFIAAANPAVVLELLARIAALQRTSTLLADRVEKAESERDRATAVLRRIEKWHGEFPETRRTDTTGTPVPYGVLYGSNGERDYMRIVARNALSSLSSGIITDVPHDDTDDDLPDTEGGSHD